MDSDAASSLPMRLSDSVSSVNSCQWCRCWCWFREEDILGGASSACQSETDTCREKKSHCFFRDKKSMHCTVERAIISATPAAAADTFPWDPFFFLLGQPDQKEPAHTPVMSLHNSLHWKRRRLKNNAEQEKEMQQNGTDALAFFLREDDSGSPRTTTIERRSFLMLLSLHCYGAHTKCVCVSSPDSSHDQVWASPEFPQFFPWVIKDDSMLFGEAKQYATIFSRILCVFASD